MSVIEKLDGVLALAAEATPGPLIAEDETQDIGRGMLMHYSVVRGADGENIIRLGYTDPNVHAFAAAINLLRDHGPAIRQAMAYRDATFDGNAVYAALDDRAKLRTSAESVADVLDALNRVARLASDSAAGEGEGHD